MVRLKDGAAEPLSINRSSFNSKMVRLKDAEANGVVIFAAAFQFQDGSIKSQSGN